ncbi:NADH:ubiquinone oxidoreductase [Pseudomonas japonica]|uniref:NADH:ubiquinone oxidoreductase n=1 Tax=Pseudomonas japonica TaxID=256466 RepID=UPI0015E2F479|nr:NADH:ubiquinone oxidoreductase [Pseudomonas japonica]MBA1241518.1 NADH:ubiquinone oxidoreductase [Pseudomonas japonica]MBA1288030.1 NADH:ubiquinone oxidoreductase [Pseudomonas japonica]
MLDLRRPSGLAVIFLLFCNAPQAQAQACIVHTQGDHVDVKVCQQNRNIPESLFKSGFCQPELKGQKVDVTYVDQCPSGAFGICSNAHVDGMPYRQDIHYYGVTSDARFLKPFCETRSQGKWALP